MIRCENCNSLLRDDGCVIPEDQVVGCINHDSVFMLCNECNVIFGEKECKIFNGKKIKAEDYE